jgi:hypothetical protein
LQSKELFVKKAVAVEYKAIIIPVPPQMAVIIYRKEMDNAALYEDIAFIFAS